MGAITTGLLLAVVATLIAFPILYFRALKRKKEGGQSLRGYLLRDEKLRQALIEEHQKKAEKSKTAAKPKPPPAGRKGVCDIIGGAGA